MNVYPISTKAIKEKFARFLEDIYKLKRCAVSTRGKTWNEKADDLISILDNGVDIKAVDSAMIESNKELFGVKEGEEESMLYNDNCKPYYPGGENPVRQNIKYKDWLLGYWGRCPNLILCTGVDKDCKRDADDRRNKLEKKESNRNIYICIFIDGKMNKLHL